MKEEQANLIQAAIQDDARTMPSLFRVFPIRCKNSFENFANIFTSVFTRKIIFGAFAISANQKLEKFKHNFKIFPHNKTFPESKKPKKRNLKKK